MSLWFLYPPTYRSSSRLLPLSQLCRRASQEQRPAPFRRFSTTSTFEGSLQQHGTTPTSVPRTYRMWRKRRRTVHPPPTPEEEFEAITNPSANHARRHHIMFKQWKELPVWHRFRAAVERKDFETVWILYNELCDAVGIQRVSHYLHNHALYGCIPELTECGRLARTRAPSSIGPTFAVYESRLKAIWDRMFKSNIRPSGGNCNFVLAFFAETGRFNAASAFVMDMARRGIEVNESGFSLLLRSLIQHGMMRKRGAPEDSRKTVRIAAAIIDAAETRGFPCTALELDAFAWILKDAGLMHEYEDLLARAYGIDLENPDRISQKYKLKREPAEITSRMLKTIIRVYGEQGQVWKMAQMFEVLSRPLPPSIHLNSSPGWNSSSHDDDDDDDFSTSGDDSGLYGTFLTRRPGRSQRSLVDKTTFTYLIRFASANRNELLARHYLVYATHEARRDTADLIRGIEQDRHMLRRPRVRVTKRMISDIFDFFKWRTKLPLVEWLVDRTDREVTAKRSELAALEALWESRSSRKPFEYASPEKEVSAFDKLVIQIRSELDRQDEVEDVDEPYLPPIHESTSETYYPSSDGPSPSIEMDPHEPYSSLVPVPPPEMRSISSGGSLLVDESGKEGPSEEDAPTPAPVHPPETHSVPSDGSLPVAESGKESPSDEDATTFNADTSQHNTVDTDLSEERWKARRKARRKARALAVLENHIHYVRQDLTEVTAFLQDTIRPFLTQSRIQRRAAYRLAHRAAGKPDHRQDATRVEDVGNMRSSATSDNAASEVSDAEKQG